MAGADWADKGTSSPRRPGGRRSRCGRARNGPAAVAPIIRRLIGEWQARDGVSRNAGTRRRAPALLRLLGGLRSCGPTLPWSCHASLPWKPPFKALAASLWRDAPLRRVGLRGHGRRTPPYDQHQARRIRPGPRPKRRTFSAEYKLRIAAEYDAAPKNEKGAILRRERLYHSHVKERRAARDAGACRSWSTSTPARRGRRSLLPRWRTIDCGATWSVWRRNWPGTRPR